MVSKFFVFIFLILALTGIVFANQIKYDIKTTNTTIAPYFLGTTIEDLKISFIDNNSKILDLNINQLGIKIGSEKLNLQKESDFTYHIRNKIINSAMIIDSKLVVNVTTLLPGSQYTNTKQTYLIGNISELIKLKSNPQKEYSNLTVDQDLNIKILFEDLKNQQIQNLKCNLNSFDSEFAFNCETLNECSISTNIIKDQNQLGIYCLFDKVTTKGTRTYPLVYEITPTLSLGVKIGELVNPKDGLIANPFELCFNAIYESGFPVSKLEKFNLTVDDVVKELYLRDNAYCFKYFLVPYTNLSKDFVFEFNKQKYTSQVNQDLKPGTYWLWFMIIVGIIIFINIILILKAIFSRDKLEDLIKQRDTYKNRLTLIKEQYLQGDINRREFETKLNEHSIKISWLNEKILQMRPTKKDIKQNLDKQEQEINELNEIEQKKSDSKKAPKELLNALFSDPNKEKVQVKDEDLMMEETQVNDNSMNELTKALEKNSFAPEEKKEGFFTRLFKRKPKASMSLESKESKAIQDVESSSKKEAISTQKVEEFKNPFKDSSMEDEFDIRKWQK